MARSWLVIAAVALTPTSAVAVERQHHLGMAPAAAALYVDGVGARGLAGGSVQYAYGLSDAFNFHAEVGAYNALIGPRRSADAPRTQPASVMSGALGASYVIDILQWVPYLRLDGGAFRFAGGTLGQNQWRMGVSLGGGLDYQLQRNLAVGVLFKQTVFVTDTSTYPSLTTGALKFEWLWGY